MPFLGNIHSPLRGRYIVIQTKGSQLNLKEVTIYGPGGYGTIFSCSNLLLENLNEYFEKSYFSKITYLHEHLKKKYKKIL